jgi:predicted Zn-dependent peptidase
MTEILTTRFDSGLALIIEPIPNARSVAICWLSPVGSAGDPKGADGLAAMLSEMVFRGAGGLSSREHSDALDRLGVQRDSRVTAHHLHLGFTLLGSRLPQALPLVVDMVRRPALADDSLEAVRSLSLAAIDSLEDDPAHLVMLRLREHHLPAPFNRHGYGEADAIERASLTDLRHAWATRNTPGGSIIGVAGAVDPPALISQTRSLLDGWQGCAAEPAVVQPPVRGSAHIEQDSAQVHLALAYDAPRAADRDFIFERLAIACLSGSTSARLFTEVRQKRSLCYSVDASYSAGKDAGWVSLYAGTTPPRAQETLDVSLGEIERLKRGVARDEFDRAIIQLKSHLIMQGESTGARAAAIAGDFFRLGRARTLEQVAAEIDAVSFGALNEYLARREIGPVTLANLGPTPLTLPAER